MTDLPAFQPDCANCVALCCMALAFDEGEDFGFDKPAGLPCPNLNGHMCGIFGALKSEGFAGCARYDCLGAGQRVSQELFANQSWRDEPELAEPMIDAFARMREVQKMLELLDASAKLDLPDSYEARRQSMVAALAPDGGFTPESFASTAVDAALDGALPFLRELRDLV
ncbi:hypothetical protein ACP2AV_08810 [Aliiroseovarius sp. PTFE2010]|uniref:hypothetical protein n=1 Tax=Aliiroseovarius sp. PTFE2010 TaxID=3417190 RepID=UPI003CEE367B